MWSFSYLIVWIVQQFYLSVLGDRVSKQLRSAAAELTRPVSSGHESYGTDISKYPLTQPIPKLAAKLQVVILLLSSFNV